MSSYTLSRFSCSADSVCLFTLLTRQLTSSWQENFFFKIRGHDRYGGPVANAGRLALPRLHKWLSPLETAYTGVLEVRELVTCQWRNAWTLVWPIALGLSASKHRERVWSLNKCAVKRHDYEEYAALWGNPPPSSWKPTDMSHVFDRD